MIVKRQISHLGKNRTDQSTGRVEDTDEKCQPVRDGQTWLLWLFEAKKRYGQWHQPRIEESRMFLTAALLGSKTAR